MGGQRKIRYNPTVSALRQGMMRFTKRIDCPMWHIEHLRQAIPVFEEMTSEMKRVLNSNSLRNLDKVTYAQGVLQSTHKTLRRMPPADPRRRGHEQLVYDPYLMDVEGHDKLQRRADLKSDGQS